MSALEYWIELYGLPENDCQRLGVAMMRMYADQQTKELRELLPDSFYANTPLEHRIKMMVDIWNRSVKVVQELQEENERLKEALLQRDVSWLPAKDSEIEGLTIKCTELENELADMTEQKDYHYNAWYQLKNKPK